MSNQFQQRSINSVPQKTTATTVTADTAYTVKVTDSLILLASTAATKVLTLPTTTDSLVRITIRMVSNTGGDYTATVVGGTLTFNAANEIATIINNPPTGAWIVESLIGATIV
jgi:hypothetical protein